MVPKYINARKSEPISPQLVLECIDVSSILAIQQSCAIVTETNILDALRGTKLTDKRLGAFTIAYMDRYARTKVVGMCGEFDEYINELHQRMQSLENIVMSDTPEKDIIEMLTNATTDSHHEILKRALGTVYYSIYGHNNGVLTVSLDICLENDLVNVLPYDYESVNKVLERINYLFVQHKYIWTFFLEEKYKHYFSTIYNACFQSDMSFDLIQKCVNIFPNLACYNKLQKRMNNDPHNTMHSNHIDLHDPVTLYKIGLNILSTMEEKVSRIESLSSSEGRELFYTRQRELTYQANMSKYDPSIIANTHSITSMDDVANYYPDDVLEYKSELGKIFYFVSSELASLHNTGNNFVTNLPLAPSFRKIVERKYHEHIAYDACMPVKQLVESVMTPPTLAELLAHGFLRRDRTLVAWSNNDVIMRSHEVPTPLPIPQTIVGSAILVSYWLDCVGTGAFAAGLGIGIFSAPILVWMWDGNTSKRITQLAQDSITRVRQTLGY